MHEVKRKQQQSQNNEWGIKSEYKERSEKENSVKNINIPKGISITLIFFFFSSHHSFLKMKEFVIMEKVVSPVKHKF